PVRRGRRQDRPAAVRAGRQGVAGGQPAGGDGAGADEASAAGGARPGDPRLPGPGQGRVGASGPGGGGAARAGLAGEGLKPNAGAQASYLYVTTLFTPDERAISTDAFRALLMVRVLFVPDREITTFRPGRSWKTALLFDPDTR